MKREAGKHATGDTARTPAGAGMTVPIPLKHYVLNIKESTSALKYSRQCGFSPSWDRDRKESAKPGLK